jgi:uncharacterized protein with GYD domain
MPKYSAGCYTGRPGLKAGGSKRKKAVEAALRTVGGKLEAFYFALGEVDVYIIADVPDNVSIAAASLVINAAGAVSVNTTVLLTPEDLDLAPTINTSPITASFETVISGYAIERLGTMHASAISDVLAEEGERQQPRPASV